jgi:2,3-diketo-5-methylthio-1-phosphopentane phosphatase
MPYAFLCDFDGTVAPDDIGAALVKRYSHALESRMASLLARWRADELATRDVIEAECATLEVSEAEALTFTRDFRLDPEFAPFARGVRERGGVVMVLSEGYGFYVRDQLERAGLAELPWAANHLRFESGRVIPEFPHAAPECPRCGNCKAAHVRRHRASGYEVVLVGDGLSDRCGASAADRVMARGELLVWCERTGIPAVPFHGFADVAAWARDRGALAKSGAPRGA